MLTHRNAWSGAAAAAMTCRGRGQWPRGQGRSPLPLLARPLPPRRAPAESPHRLQGRKHSDKQTYREPVTTYSDWRGDLHRTKELFTKKDSKRIFRLAVSGANIGIQYFGIPGICLVVVQNMIFGPYINTASIAQALCDLPPWVSFVMSPFLTPTPSQDIHCDIAYIYDSGKSIGRGEVPSESWICVHYSKRSESQTQNNLHVKKRT